MKTAVLRTKKFQTLRKKAKAFLELNPDAIALKTQDIRALLQELSIHQIELEMQNDELRNAQAIIEESRNHYVDLYDFAPISYITIDDNYCIVSCNFASAELLSIERMRLYNKKFLNFIPENSQNTLIKFINRLAIDKPRQVFELELLRKNEDRCFVKMEAILCHKGQIRMAITDITYRKQIELKLIEYNKKLCLINNLFQSSSEAIAALDQNLRLTEYNEAFAQTFLKIFGLTAISGANLVNLFIDSLEQQNAIIYACQQALAGKSTAFIHEASNADKNYYCYEIKISPISAENAQVIGLMLLLRDITAYKLEERRNAKRQAEIAYVSRMNVMGEMAAALAHEINQPLTAISTLSQVCAFKLEKSLADIQELLPTLQTMASQVEHAGKIIHRTKNFMREGKMYYERANINEIIKDTITLMQHELQEAQICIAYDLMPGPLLLTVDRTQISQVILNLARNSLEAIQNNDILQANICIRTRRDCEIVTVDILDNGPGVPQEYIDKVLSTYFTTKQQGTGLGLPICRNLIEMHGGKLLVRNNPAGGAWFQFTLPIFFNDNYADA